MDQRVFLARLAGTSVFDPNGDRVGRVRDAVISRPSSNKSPRVRGLVVELPPKRKIFIPLSRIIEISAEQVVSTGVLNMRRLQLHSDEILGLADLRNTTIAIQNNPIKQKIVDLAMGYDTKSKEWSITSVFVKGINSNFMRRTDNTLVPWSEVKFGDKLNSSTEAENIALQISQMRAADAAKHLLTLNTELRWSVSQDLDDETLAGVIEELPEDDRVALIGRLEETRAVDVLEEMDPDDAADLLSELPPETAATYLELMEPGDAEDLRRLLTYGDYTAGGMMSSDPVVLAPDATVAQALAAVREEEISPAMASQVFVVRPPTDTPTGRFLGVAHIQRLLRETPSTAISAVLDTDLAPVSPGATLSEVTRLFATYNLVALPVTDDAGRLVGAITADDLIDHMLPENWRELKEGANG
ncbi:MAG: magnesium transporter [actinobacterium acAMD-5]|jgi:CBS domain-containing protein|nr:MAG: magnesium transporter [actinobacterium acAMD-5]